MPKVYSEDFRLQALSCVKRGKSYEEVCNIFEIGIATLYRWIYSLNKHGSLLPKKHGSRPSKKIEPSLLIAAIEKTPDATLEELSESFGCWPQSIHKRCIKLGLTRKKNDTIYRAKRGKKA